MHLTEHGPASAMERVVRGAGKKIIDKHDKVKLHVPATTAESIMKKYKVSGTVGNIPEQGCECVNAAPSRLSIKSQGKHLNTFKLNDKVQVRHCLVLLSNIWLHNSKSQEESTIKKKIQ